MTVADEKCGLKIEAGQIINPGTFPHPFELVCIQVAKVFDQVAIRDCQSGIQIPLTPSPGNPYPVYSFEGASDFDIVDIKVLSKTDCGTRPGYKKLKLAVRVRFTVSYFDGVEHLTTVQDVVFNLTVNEIYCPCGIAQIAITGRGDAPDYTFDEDGTLIKVEGIIEVFNDAIQGSTLFIDVGGFFIVKCEQIVQLLIPSYGYCPIPPEQNNPANYNCTTFLNRDKTPFPTKFFPDQKWNPLN